MATALFGKARLSVLGLLYSHPDEAFYLREIIRRVGAGQGAVQRELARLTEVGILLRRVDGSQVYYQANKGCPIFNELRGLVIKTVGVIDVLRAGLADLAERTGVAFVYGSTAKGTAKADSDVDILVVGSVTFGEVASALARAQETLQREVNATVYPTAEFQEKLAQGHHFVSQVVREPKLFIIGGEHELEGLAK